MCSYLRHHSNRESRKYTDKLLEVAGYMFYLIKIYSKTNALFPRYIVLNFKIIFLIKQLKIQPLCPLICLVVELVLKRAKV